MKLIAYGEVRHVDIRTTPTGWYALYDTDGHLVDTYPSLAEAKVVAVLRGLVR